MTTLESVELTCPCCGTEFESEMWGSTNNFGPLMTDLYRQAAGFPSLPLEMYCCPECGFCGDENEFEPEADECAPKVVDATLVEWVRENLTPLVKQREFTADERYECSARISEQRGEPLFDQAWLWLKAAWCCYHEEPGRPEDRYRREAATRFAQAMEDGHVPKEERPIVVYLVGELNRRIGNAEEAARWFARVPDEVADNEDLKWLLHLAIQQSTEPKEVVEEE